MEAPEPEPPGKNQGQIKVPFNKLDRTDKEEPTC